MRRVKMSKPNSNRIGTKIHQLQTWDHYPRAKYFQRYLQNVYPRFRRVTDFLPILDEKILDNISANVKLFDVPPELVVFGNEQFPVDKMVVRGKEEMLLRKQVEGSGPRVVVCVVLVEQVTDSFRQALTATLQEVMKMTLSNTNRLFVVCHIAPQETTVDLEVLRNFIHERCHHLKAEHLIVNYEQESQTCEGASSNIMSIEQCALGQTIDSALENDIIDILVTMYWYLDEFIEKPTQREYVFPLGDSMVTFFSILEDTLIRCLSNKHLFKHILEEGLSKEDVLLDAVCQCIRSTCVPELSKSFNVDMKMCVHVMDTVQFESEIQLGVTQITRELLKKITVEVEKDNIKKSVDCLLKDIRPFIDLVTMKIYRLTDVVKKMKHELQNCIKLSNKDLLPRRIKLDTDSLLKAISSIKGVYGFGEVYGELEFHIEEAEYENTLDDIRSLLQEFKYLAPYKVLFVAKKPEVFKNPLHDSGQLIHAQFIYDSPCEGTLGLFFVAEDNSDDLFAITCGHVVSVGADKIAEQVFINEGKSRVMLGTAVKDMIVTDIIDIAAIKVHDYIKPMCSTTLKNDQDIYCPAHILEMSPAAITDDGLFPFVYKHGGRSGLTYGTISSSNFQIRKSQDSFADCLLLIEPQADIEITPFGKSGDSGAVVCGTSPGSDDIQIVSILTSGNYMIVGDPVPRCLSFMLIRGLQALEASSSMKLVLH